MARTTKTKQQRQQHQAERLRRKAEKLHAEFLVANCDKGIAEKRALVFEKQITEQTNFYEDKIMEIQLENEYNLREMACENDRRLQQQQEEYDLLIQSLHMQLETKDEQIISQEREIINLRRHLRSLKESSRVKIELMKNAIDHVYSRLASKFNRFFKRRQVEDDHQYLLGVWSALDTNYMELM